jgi:hypothetical protein
VPPQPSPIVPHCMLGEQGTGVHGGVVHVPRWQT